MKTGYAEFLSLRERDRRDVFEEAADRLDTLPSYIEKDFWVCLVLEVLFNRLPADHPRLLFKGGTSLSKAFGLINRFSEDIDLVVHRTDLGFYGDRDPTGADNLSLKKRRALFTELKRACSDYVIAQLAVASKAVLGDRVTIRPDDEDGDRQTLLLEYETLFPMTTTSYVQPRVKLEAGARSALEPHSPSRLEPYAAKILGDDWSLTVLNVRTIDPARTYLDKLLILHGTYCGYRDQERLPTDKDRISRHYYDIAVMTNGEMRDRALGDEALLADVRRHSEVAFRQAWKRLDEAVPGSLRLVPQGGLRDVIRRDYDAMAGMILGEIPSFEWVLEQLHQAEEIVNERAARQSDPLAPTPSNRRADGENKGSDGL